MNPTIQLMHEGKHANKTRNTNKARNPDGPHAHILPAGLEPATFRLLAECSNQLSYESLLLLLKEWVV